MKDEFCKNHKKQPHVWNNIGMKMTENGYMQDYYEYYELKIIKNREMEDCVYYEPDTVFHNELGGR